jgi:hypothetical protein
MILISQRSYIDRGDAGFDQNVSAPSGVVRAAPVAPPAVTPPAPVPRPTAPVTPRALTGRVARTRCGGRTCRLTLVLRGPVSRVRVDLRRGTKRLARVTRRARAGTVVVNGPGEAAPDARHVHACRAADRRRRPHPQLPADLPDPLMPATATVSGKFRIPGQDRGVG